MTFEAVCLSLGAFLLVVCFGTMYDGYPLKIVGTASSASVFL